VSLKKIAKVWRLVDENFRAFLIAPRAHLRMLVLDKISVMSTKYDLKHLIFRLRKHQELPTKCVISFYRPIFKTAAIYIRYIYQPI